MKMPSVMKKDFSKVPKISIERSTFDRSHGIKTAFDGGYLVPIYTDEALPGDTFNLRLSAFARLATPVKPVLDNLFLDTFWFAVPMRLLWTNWEKFNGAQTDPGDSTDFTCPQISGAVTVSSLGDYLGLPLGGGGLTYNAFWHRAYNLIWKEFFRDENLQDSPPINTGDGPDNVADYTLRRRGKRHDYFTSCLPFAQKGDAVSLPLGSFAPVIGIGKENQTWTAGPRSVYETGETAVSSFASYSNIDPAAANHSYYVEEDPNNAGFPGIYADLATATAATINQLREAEWLQVLFERDARGGTRYTEIIRSQFGIVSPDFRLQRPEILAMGSSPINIHPVPQMAISGATPQGNLAAFGTASVSGHGFNKSFTEHCVLIGLASVRADLSYQQGMNRMFNRRTRYDFYWPALSSLGEQAVLRQEIYAVGNPALDELVFGYQERYADYRYKPSQITGIMRSTAAGTLDVWHLAQNFSSPPELNATFIQDDPPIDRVIAVPSEPHLLFDGYVKLTCARPMPVFSIPGLGRRF